MSDSFLNTTGSNSFNSTDCVYLGTNSTNGTLLCQTSTEVLPGNDVTKGTTNPVIIGLDYANYILQPLLLILGIIGNSLTIAIMNTKRFSKITSRYFLVAMAIADTILILTQPFNKKFIIEMIGRDLRALSDAGCKIFFILFRTGKMTSSWFVVFICLERFIAVWFPLKAKLIVTRRIALIGISVVILVIGGFNTGWSYCSKIRNGFCFPDEYDRNDPVAAGIYGRMLAAGCALYSFMPIGFLTIITPLILFQLSRVRQARKKLTSGGGSNNSSDNVKTTAMLLLVMVAYVILVAPVTTLHITAYFLKVNSFGDNGDGYLIYRNVVQILEQINYSINFFLYVVASQQFRKGLVSILKIDQCQAWMKKKSERSSGKSKTNSGKNANTAASCPKKDEDDEDDVEKSKNADQLEKYE